MPIKVNIPEHNAVINFPDGTPPEVMKKAIESNFPSKMFQSQPVTPSIPSGQTIHPAPADMKSATSETAKNILSGLGKIPSKFDFNKGTIDNQMITPLGVIDTSKPYDPNAEKYSILKALGGGTGIGGVPSGNLKVLPFAVTCII